MKLKKAEKLWLAATVLSYAFYNLPGFPAYGDQRNAIIHGLISIVLIWGSCYVGFVKVNKLYKLKNINREETK